METNAESNNTDSSSDEENCASKHKPPDAETKLREKNGAIPDLNLTRAKPAKPNRTETTKTAEKTACSRKQWPQNVERPPEGEIAECRPRNRPLRKWSEPPYSEFRPQAEENVYSRMTAISDPSPTGPTILPFANPTLPPLHTPGNPLMTTRPTISCPATEQMTTRGITSHPHTHQTAPPLPHPTNLPIAHQTTAKLCYHNVYSRFRLRLSTCPTRGH